MLDIVTLLVCLGECMDKKMLVQLCHVVQGMLSMTGRVTMLGISRWTEKGSSYRTIQRFFNSKIEWNWAFIRHYVLKTDDIFLLVGDPTTVTKSGHKTYGLDRFYSSLFKKPVPGVSFFCWALVSVTQGQSYPLLMEQQLKEPSAPKEEEAPQTRGKGRPKGSKNKNRRDIELSSYLVKLQKMVQKI